jgi:hypothetical protein
MEEASKSYMGHALESWDFPCVFQAAPKHALWCAEHPWSTSVRCRQYNVPLSLRRSSTLADVCCLHRGTQRILAGTDGVLRVHAGAVRLSLCHSGRFSLRHNGRLKKATEEQVSTARWQPLSTERLLSTVRKDLVCWREVQCAKSVFLSYLKWSHRECYEYGFFSLLGSIEHVRKIWLLISETPCICTCTNTVYARVQTPCIWTCTNTCICTCTNTLYMDLYKHPVYAGVQTPCTCTCTNTCICTCTNTLYMHVYKHSVYARVQTPCICMCTNYVLMFWQR